MASQPPLLTEPAGVSAPPSRIPPRVAVLTAGAFAMGTDAFVVAGVLPDISRSLAVSVAAAGQLVTVFSIAYALLSPLLAAITGHWSRRAVLLTALAVFVLGNTATALAPSYALVLATRVVAAAGAALFTPNAGAAAAAISPPERRGGAISLVTLGLTSSTALGVPIGTALGTVLDWRGTMWFVVALGVLAAVGVARWLPAVPAPPVVGLRQRFAPLGDRRVGMALLTTVVMFVAVYVVNTYLSVIVQRATSGSGTTLAVLLFCSGCAGMVGVHLSGRLSDRHGARWVLVAAALVLAVDYALLPFLGATLVGAVVGVLVFGLGAWCITVPQQHRMIAMRPQDAPVVVSLSSSATYLAVSLAGLIGAGALGLVAPWWLPWVAGVFVLLGLTSSEVTHRLERPRS